MSDETSKVSGHTFYNGIVHLNRQSIAKSHPRYQPFLDHLAMVESTLNAAFIDAGLPIRVATDEVSDSILRGRDAVNRFLAGESDGVLHQPQLQTFVEVLESILTAPTMNVAVNGVTQCGKTGTSNAMYFLGPILYILNRERYATMLLTINRQSSYDQTRTEFERFVALYEFLKFYHKDGDLIEVDGEEYVDLNYSGYWETILKQALPRELGLSRTTDQIRTRSHGRTAMAEMKAIFDTAKQEKIILALLVDETHFGSGASGTQAEIFDYILPELKSTASKSIFIGFSATNWELCNLPNVSQVYHRLGDGYVGFNVFNGRVVDAQAAVKAPLYYGVTEFQKLFGFRRLDEISSSAYGDSDSFRNNRLLSRLHPGYWNYCRWVEEMFADLIHWSLGIEAAFHHNKPVNANPQDGRGIAIRFCRSNDKASDFAAMLRTHLDARIEVIEYFAGGNSVRVKEAIERRRNGDGPYVIIMTASGRLADSFPPHCTYFTDFTHQTQNFTALMQGTVGRATGYNKNSLIVLSDSNAEALSRYASHLGSADAGKVGERVVQPTTRGRPRTMVHLVRDLITDPLLIEKLKAVDGELRYSCFKGIKLPYPRRGGNNRCKLWSIFDEETLRYIESNAVAIWGDDIQSGSISLLRPGETVLGVRYDLHRSGDAMAGLRQAIGTTSHQANSSHRYLNAASTKDHEKKGIHIHRPQIFYDPETGRVVAVSLRCSKGYYTRAEVAAMHLKKPLPSSKSHMKHFAEGETRAMIDAVEAEEG